MLKVNDERAQEVSMDIVVTFTQTLKKILFELKRDICFIGINKSFCLYVMYGILRAS